MHRNSRSKQEPHRPTAGEQRQRSHGGEERRRIGKEHAHPAGHLGLHLHHLVLHNISIALLLVGVPAVELGVLDVAAAELGEGGIGEGEEGVVTKREGGCG